MFDPYFHLDPGTQLPSRTEKKPSAWEARNLNNWSEFGSGLEIRFINEKSIGPAGESDPDTMKGRRPKAGEPLLPGLQFGFSIEIKGHASNDLMIQVEG